MKLICVKGVRFTLRQNMQSNISFNSKMKETKEYILVIECTAPPASSKHVSHPTSPPSVRHSGSWSGVLYVYYRQSRKMLDETHVWMT